MTAPEKVAETADLLTALKTYGQHLPNGCELNFPTMRWDSEHRQFRPMRETDGDPKCTCGFDAALLRGEVASLREQVIRMEADTHGVSVAAFGLKDRAEAAEREVASLREERDRLIASVTTEGYGMVTPRTCGICGKPYPAWSVTSSTRCSDCKLASLSSALKTLLERYVALVNSGDAGQWDPETEAEVIAARAALSGTTGPENKP